MHVAVFKAKCVEVRGVEDDLLGLSCPDSAHCWPGKKVIAALQDPTWPAKDHFYSGTVFGQLSQSAKCFTWALKSQKYHSEFDSNSS